MRGVLFFLLHTLLAGCAGSLFSGDQSLVQKDALVAERAHRETLEKQNQELRQELKNLEVKYQTLGRGRQDLEKEYQGLKKDHQALVRDREQLEKALKNQVSSGPSSEEDLARLKLLLLEKEAQLKVLTEKLDEAILEVVRIMAKLRSLQSKAEAASNLAEAEIALKLFKNEAAGKGKDLDVAQAEQMLKLGSQEFKKENYGGAVYLTTKVKDLIKGGQTRSISRGNMQRVDGEVLFALPLPLKVVRKSNVREGPGLDYKVLFAAEEGTTLLGQSRKGMWVHVETEDGRPGWIYYDLIEGQ